MMEVIISRKKREQKIPPRIYDHEKEKKGNIGHKEER